MAASQAAVFVLLVLTAMPAAFGQIDVGGLVNQAMGFANAATSQANNVAAQAVNQANTMATQAVQKANTMAASAQAMAQKALQQALKPQTAGGVGSSTCGNLAMVTGSACNNGNCCSVQQKVYACKGLMEASANINGKYSMCCVALINKKTGKPQQWCGAGGSSEKYMRIPSSAKVTMAPSCSSPTGSGAGQMLCSVQFASIPKGYMLPGNTNWNKAYQPAVAGGFAPCGNGQYKTFKQITVGGNTAQSQCF